MLVKINKVLFTQDCRSWSKGKEKTKKSEAQIVKKASATISSIDSTVIRWNCAAIWSILEFWRRDTKYLDDLWILLVANNTLIAIELYAHTNMLLDERSFEKTWNFEGYSRIDRRVIRTQFMEKKQSKS